MREHQEVLTKKFFHTILFVIYFMKVDYRRVGGVGGGEDRRRGTILENYEFSHVGRVCYSILHCNILILVYVQEN
jgi:hypothetical protein